MVLEIATILLGASVGAVVVIYAAARGYLGHKKKAAAPVTSIDTYAATTEQAEVPATEAPAVAEPAPSPAPEPTPAPEAAPSPAPAPYESVQPAPAPVTFSAPSSASFGAPTLAKKPTRTYRRRTAPVRSAAGVKKALAKPKKR
jgi:hypothetical protein